MSSSIYKTIYSAIENGCLPDGFSLRQEQDGGIQWAPGAMDGVYIYHMAHETLPQGALDLLDDAFDEGSAGDYVKAEQLFHEWTEDHRTISAIRALQGRLYNRRDELDGQNVFLTALYLIMESEHIECVKAGLTILEAFGDADEDVQDIIFQLGLYDEFTLYALRNMSNWEDGNREMFELAKLVHGWGRIHAVNMIKPETEQIREWLLTEGIHNDVMPAYSALACWNKGNAEQALSAPMHDDIYHGILEIAGALLEEGPVSGISSLKDPEGSLRTILDHAGEHPLTAEDYEVILSIRDWANGQDPALSELSKQADLLLHSPEALKVIEEAVSFGRSIGLAEELGIPFLSAAYNAMETDFEHQYHLCSCLLAEPAYRDKVIKLFRKNLNEQDTGPDDKQIPGNVKRISLLLNLQDYPLTGAEFVKDALRSNTDYERAQAVSVLKAWIEQTDTPLSELSPDLYQAALSCYKQETMETVRETLGIMLEGFTVFTEKTE